MYDIKLPINIKAGSKVVPINLNWYRNAHFFSLNDAKKNFLEQIKPQLNIPKFNKIHIRYKLWMRTAHKSDVANFCSIVDKFFCDALTHCEIIPDDNFEHIPGVIYEFGGLDKQNPRVDATIIPL